VPVPSERNMPPERVRAAAKTAGIVCVETADVAEGLQAAREWARTCRGAVCVAGSLFLVGAVLAMAKGVSYEQGGGDYIPGSVPQGR